MPTDTDKELAARISELATQLGDFRVAVEKGFGSIGADLAGFKAKTDIAIKVGVWVAGVVTTLAIALVWSAVSTGFRLGSIDADIRNQGKQLAHLERIMTPSYQVPQTVRGNPDPHGSPPK